MKPDKHPRNDAYDLVESMLEVGSLGPEELTAHLREAGLDPERIRRESRDAARSADRRARLQSFRTRLEDWIADLVGSLSADLTPATLTRSPTATETSTPAAQGPDLRETLELLAGGYYAETRDAIRAHGELDRLSMEWRWLLGHALLGTEELSEARRVLESITGARTADAGARLQLLDELEMDPPAAD